MASVAQQVVATYQAGACAASTNTPALAAGTRPSMQQAAGVVEHDGGAGDNGGSTDGAVKAVGDWGSARYDVGAAAAAVGSERST